MLSFSFFNSSKIYMYAIVMIALTLHQRTYAAERPIALEEKFSQKTMPTTDPLEAPNNGLNCLTLLPVEIGNIIAGYLFYNETVDHLKNIAHPAGINVCKPLGQEPTRNLVFQKYTITSHIDGTLSYDKQQQISSYTDVVGLFGLITQKGPPKTSTLIQRSILYKPENSRAWTLVQAHNTPRTGALCANISFNHKHLAFLVHLYAHTISIPSSLHIIDLPTLKQIKEISLLPAATQQDNLWSVSTAKAIINDNLLGATLVIPNEETITTEELQKQGYTHNVKDNTWHNKVLATAISQSSTHVAIATQTRITIINTTTNELNIIRLNLARYRNEDSKEYAMGFNRLGTELIYTDPTTGGFSSFKIKQVTEDAHNTTIPHLLSQWLYIHGVCKPSPTYLN